MKYPERPSGTVGQALLIASILIVGMRLFIFDIVRVEGASMEPVVSDEQTILVNRLAYEMSNPRRGDIAVLRPSKAGPSSVKRIFGLPGDPIELRAGRYLKLNRESFLLSSPVSRALEGLDAIPAGFYFVVGDNPERSYDSRHFGLVSREELRGRSIGEPND